MTKIGVSTASYFSKLQTEDAVLDIARRNVPLCEVFLNSFSEYEPAYIDLLEERLSGTPLEVYSVHPMSLQFEPQLFSIQSRQHGDAWKLFETVLADGKRLGASHYVMHGPACLSGAAKNISLVRIAPILADLSALAKTYGITLTLENVSWCVFHSPEFGMRLVDAIGPDALKYTLDVKQALRSGYDPLDYVDAVGDLIENVHLCDSSLDAAGLRDYVMPGFGAYDFSKLFAALYAHGYQGPAIIEVYSDMYRDFDTLYESYARIERVANGS